MSSLNPSSGFAIAEISVGLIGAGYFIYRLEQSRNSDSSWFNFGSSDGSWFQGVEDWWNGLFTPAGTYPINDPRNPNYDPNYNTAHLSPEEMAAQHQAALDAYYSQSGAHASPGGAGASPPVQTGAQEFTSPAQTPTNTPPPTESAGTPDYSAMDEEWAAAAGALG